MICKLARDGMYDKALAYTHQLTNATDRYKFQLDICKVAGDSAKAYKALERFQEVKGSVNNVIMSEELIETAKRSGCSKGTAQNGDVQIERTYLLADYLPCTDYYRHTCHLYQEPSRQLEKNETEEQGT
jgi:hypothetical protein